MPGTQEIYEERWEPGPDGKPVKKIYTLKRELTDEQAAELVKEAMGKFPPVMPGMFNFAPPSKKKKGRALRPNNAFDLMFHAIDRMFRGG